MKYIELTRGYKTKVCDCHYVLVSQYNWHYHPSHNKNGYAARTVNKSTTVSKTHKQFMHQLLLPAKDGFTIDHINQDTLDNRCSNFRYATVSQQMANRKQKNNSEFRGVYSARQPNRWQAQIRIKGKLKQIGTFSDPSTAALAYNKIAQKVHGPFAVLNKGVES